MEMTLQKIYYENCEKLKKAGIANANQEVAMLMEYEMGITRSYMLTHFNEIVAREKIDAFKKKINRRIKYEPLQYIIGTQEFMDLTFKVSPDVLIPRQDTEILIETILQLYKEKSNIQVLDLCTGSGCIAICLSKYLMTNEIIATDISVNALEIAKQNAMNLMQGNIKFIKSDLFNELLEFNKYFDVIVSNPPYIPSSDISELMPEVRLFEPMLALDGKKDGLHFYRIIIKKAKEYLKSDGMLFFEIGYNQGEAVTSIFENEGYKNINIVNDYVGLNRVVYGNLA